MAETRPRFIADENVGKLARLLRLLGFDTLFFQGEDDARLVEMAVAEDRIILTRDTRIPLRKQISRGKIRTVLLRDDRSLKQIGQVMLELGLNNSTQPFTLCLECNRPLRFLTREEAKDRVPPYVRQTQNDYVECPNCNRVYWKGTHWTAMNMKLAEIETGGKDEKRDEPKQIQKTDDRDDSAADGDSRS
jgi:uncharacterized protein